MSDLAQTITALGTLVAAIGAVIIGYRNSKAAADAREKARDAANAATAAKLTAEHSQAEIVATKDGVFEVGKKIDGRLDELLELTKQAALAEGRLQGRASERDERP